MGIGLLERVRREGSPLVDGSMEYLADCNQKMFRLLKARGIECVYREYAGGHNFTVWRNAIPQARYYLYGV